MFIGHYTLAFGAKRLGPGVSLGTLFLACEFADLLWPTLVLLGIERVEVEPGNTAFTPLNFISYPYSHGLVMLLTWSAIFALAYRTIRGWRPQATGVVALLVFSHFVLDFITHRPDLPITISGSTRVGLGLWNAPIATLIVESLLFIAGVTLYAAATTARTRAGVNGLWVMVGLMVAIYFASAFGPPPPNATAVVASAELLWLFVAAAYWVDRQRSTVRV